jgi:TonB family protein
LDDWAATSEELRQRQFRRVVGISAVFHGVTLLFLIWNPMPRSPAALPGVVAVRFVSLPSPGPSAPEAEPEAAPPPKPVPPIKEKVVLPVEPKKLEEPKPKPEVKVEPKPKPEPKPEAKKPEPKPEVKPQPKPPEPEENYEDVLAKLRTQAGETSAQAPTAATATIPGPALGMPGSATGVPLSPEEAAWYRRAKVHLARSWMLAPGFRTQALSTLVRVDLDAQGNLVGAPQIERRSGNPWYDDSAVRAVQKASPLPPPPGAGEYTIEFRPEEFF